MWGFFSVKLKSLCERYTLNKLRISRDFLIIGCKICKIKRWELVNIFESFVSVCLAHIWRTTIMRIDEALLHCVTNTRLYILLLKGGQCLFTRLCHERKKKQGRCLPCDLCSFCTWRFCSGSISAIIEFMSKNSKNARICCLHQSVYARSAAVACLPLALRWTFCNL